MRLREPGPTWQPIRVLIIHNRYRMRGGEDVVFEGERRLLLEKGEEVHSLIFDNATIPTPLSLRRKASLAVETLWSRGAVKRIRTEVERLRPDVVHFHNTFPLVSPAGYGAARSSGAAVVQTLHNYRLLCPNALFLRDGGPCEACLGRLVSWPGIRYACYRDSRVETAVVSSMQAVHWALGTWNRDVDRYIALTEFGRSKFVEGGIAPELVEVKPNFVDIVSAQSMRERKGFLFVGRIEQAKGISVLLNAWRMLQPAPELQIIGDGPLLDEVRDAAAATEGVTVTGRLDRARVLEEMASASALVFPSIWYEACPMTIAEAFACGTPVIASRLGAMRDLIHHERTGILFEPATAQDLASKVAWAVSHADRMAQMGAAAREEYEAKYMPEANYSRLRGIYERAMARREVCG